MWSNGLLSVRMSLGQLLYRLSHAWLRIPGLGSRGHRSFPWGSESTMMVTLGQTFATNMFFGGYSDPE